MFEYKDFVFGRVDQYNIELHQHQDKEEVVGGGKGKGRGTKTGNMVRSLVFLGYHNTMAGVLHQILLTDLEATEVKDFNKALKEHKEFVNTLFSKVNIPIEEKRIAEQVGEED